MYTLAKVCGMVGGITFVQSCNNVCTHGPYEIQQDKRSRGGGGRLLIEDVEHMVTV